LYWVAPSKAFFLYCVSFEIREKTAGEDRKKQKKIVFLSLWASLCIISLQCPF
jgi:hypothetical protein